MKRILSIFCLAMTMASCGTYTSLRKAPVAEIPDLGDPVYDSIKVEWRAMARRLATEGKMNPVSGNRLKIYTEGRSKFADFNADLARAEKFIDMEYYRFAADTIAGQVKEILLDRAEAGVPVRMILESRSNAKKYSFYRTLRKAEGVFTVDVVPLGDIASNILNVDFRDHRKIAVVDGKFCYTGGMNIADQYHTDWRDTHVRLEGPIVEDFMQMFDDTWFYFGGSPFAARPVVENIDNGAIMQLAGGGPHMREKPIKEGFEQAINTAKDYIWIQTPYLCPPPSTIKALKQAADRGVDVRLMLPKGQDVAVMLWVNHFFYKKLLKRGVKIYERDDPFMHSKSYVADDYVSCYGSANMDNRSYDLNFENNVYIYDEDVARQSKEIFEEDLRHSREIKREDVKWPFWEVFLQNFFILIGYSQW